MAAVLLLIIFTTRIKEIKDIDEDEDDEEEEEDLDSSKNMPSKLKRNFVFIVLIGILVVLGMTVLDYQTMLGDDIGIKAQNIYKLYSSSVIITAVFSIVGGIIIDKFEAKKLYLVYVFICFASCAVLLIHNVYGVIINSTCNLWFFI